MRHHRVMIRPAPSSYALRSETTADAAGVRAVIEAAFGDEGGTVAAIWRDITAGDLPHRGLVATVAGQVVGHVGVSHAWLDTRERLVDVALLSPLGVLPAHQGSGIGGALLAEALDVSLPVAPMLVLEGDPGYYGRWGFVAGATRGVLPATDRTPGPAFQVVVGPGHEAWMTGRVVYPDVWWRHDAAGLRDPLLTELEQAFGGDGS